MLGVSSVTVSFLIYYESLLQNATELYYKMRHVFCYNMRSLLLIATVHNLSAQVSLECSWSAQVPFECLSSAL